ncbi:MAG TPA: prephenate dehydrogenase [Acidimicrobiia bacterium]|nr:prephenate dehydrogenase [Acidimicrobiia bacterium]
MRIAVIGTGLVGGSIGLALSALGHEVVGFDRDPDRLTRARDIGAIGKAAPDAASAASGADIAFVAVPVGAIVAAVQESLDAGAALVTDVGSVKGPVVAEVARLCPEHAARFIGGHPMAGSEQEGIDGARPDLFVGAAWVVTPTADTPEDAYTSLAGVLRDLQAEVVAVTPEEHDVLVAFVSHVPQLAASTLMDVATTHEAQHRALLRLAAGGFRDMTRIAASQPSIWIDILTSNRDAVLGALDAYLVRLQHARDIVAAGDRDAIEALLARARSSRRNLPVGISLSTKLVELHVVVPDKPGALADVTTLGSRLGVNIADLEIAHSKEGGGGVLVLIVSAADADAFVEGLRERGYRVNRSEIE